MYKSIEMLESAAPVVFGLWTTAAHYLFGRKMGPLFNTSSNMFTPGKVKVNFICSHRMALFGVFGVNVVKCIENKHIKNKSLWEYWRDSRSLLRSC